MGTKYPTQSISGYNSSPPPDDGTTGDDNKVTWAKHKTKLGDPVKTLAEAMNTAIVNWANNTPTAKSSNYTTVASDNNKIIQCTSSPTITLGTASTMGAGYEVSVKNAGSGTVTVATGETIDGSASNRSLTAGDVETYVVNAAGSAYHITGGLNTDSTPDEVITTTGDLIVGDVSATAARLAIGTDGQFLRSDSTQSDGLGWQAPYGESAMTDVTTSTGVTITGIAAWATEVTIILNGISLSGTNDLLLQLGHSSGTMITTGYAGTVGSSGVGNEAWNTSGAQLTYNGGADSNAYYNIVKLFKHDDDVWAVESQRSYKGQTGGAPVHSDGYVDVTDTLDSVKLLPNGANTFDAGEWMVRWR